MAQPTSLDFSSLNVGGSQSELLQSLARFLEEVAEYHGSDSEEGSGGQDHNCGCGGGGGGGTDEVSLDGEFSIVGDPHISGTIEVDGEDVTFNFTTEGGNGKIINLLDTDSLDIRGKFDKLTRSDGNTYVTEETITFGTNKVEIDADDNVVKLNGKAIEDGVHHCNGNTITKTGDKVTIETADGQKIVIEDKGDYLDTKVTLDDYESKQIGGMIGDAIKGNTNDEAKDYIYSSSTVDPVSHPREQDGHWAVQLLKSLAGMLGSSDPALGQFLTALANFIERSQSGGTETGAAA